MRDAFTRALMREAAKDDRLMLVTGDLGFGVLKPFWETYPEQFVNAGIAEQSMTGLAAGLAKTGRTVLTYSIGNFPTLRCLEQIRNDCAYHNLNVKVVCVGGGFVYGSLGMSHHATEDMAIMRALPGVTVFTPGDPAEVEAIVPVMLKTPGTCYLRLGRGGEPTLHEQPVTDWQMPKALTLQTGTDIAILSAGGILTQTEALRQTNYVKSIVTAQGKMDLERKGMKPIDAEKIAELTRRFRHIVTVEEHSIVGGFGSAVCEVAAETGNPCRIHRIGMEDVYSTIVGTQQYLRAQYQMDDEAIARRAAQWLREE